jgi:hypothetical protein
MIDAGSHGICILANFSEQFVLTDAEREEVMDAALKHVAGRVPVIVTTTHFSSRFCTARSRQAQEAGAAMVMIMPPYHGATFRVSEKAIFEFYRVVSDAIDIPIMIQDAPVAGTPLSVDLLARVRHERSSSNSTPVWAGRRCRRLLPNQFAQGLADHLKKCAVFLAAQHVCGNRENLMVQRDRER